MIDKINFLLFLLILCSFESYSQAKIDFQIAEHDFGNLSEGTMASFDFNFTNNGNEPLIINSVRASCGCTTPYWTKEPVMPGKQGKITASYDSNGRPGAFHKSVTVTSNAQELNKTLYIKGVVISKNNLERVFSDQELSESPKINISKSILQVGKVEKGQKVPISVEVKNDGKTDLIISQVKAPCNCVIIENNSHVINPGKTEKVTIIYAANTIGSKQEPVVLYSNDLANPENKIILEAEVVENLSNKNMLKERSATITF